MSQSSVTPVGAREVPSSNPFGEALLQAVNLMIERKIEQESARMRWATVTSVKSGGFNPTELRIRYDQETKSSPVTPIDLDGNLSVGDRVRVIWFKGQATILPRSGWLGGTVLTAAAGAVSVSGNVENGAGVTETITFPANRFTQPPYLVALPEDGARLTLSSRNVTTSSATLRAYNWSGGNAPSGIRFIWVAVQV